MHFSYSKSGSGSNTGLPILRSSSGKSSTTLTSKNRGSCRFGQDRHFSSSRKWLRLLPKRCLFKLPAKRRKKSSKASSQTLSITLKSMSLTISPLSKFQRLKFIQFCHVCHKNKRICSIKFMRMVKIVKNQ